MLLFSTEQEQEASKCQHLCPTSSERQRQELYMDCLTIKIGAPNNRNVCQNMPIKTQVFTSYESTLKTTSISPGGFPHLFSDTRGWLVLSIQLNPKTGKQNAEHTIPRKPPIAYNIYTYIYIYIAMVSSGYIHLFGTIY